MSFQLSSKSLLELTVTVTQQISPNITAGRGNMRTMEATNIFNEISLSKNS